jgi:hypothetical protein
VAFYDASMNLLTGAAYPDGWPGAGTYHYFGRINEIPPATYTIYGIAFGPNETAKIPEGAKFCSIGALLQYSGIGENRMSNVRLWLKNDADLLVDGSIIASKLAANAIAVGTAAIQNGAIVNAMIGTAAIDDAKIANLSAEKITTGNLNAARIAVGSIDARIATITDAQIQSLSAGKIVATYLSSITANLGAVTSGTIDLNSYNNTWSYVRSAGKWFDENSGFILAGYAPSGSHYFDLKSGSSRIQMYGGGEWGTNQYAYIRFGNDTFYADHTGYVQATNIYARGNIEATTLNVNAANIVSTLNLQGNAVIIPAASESIVAYTGNMTWQNIGTVSISAPELVKVHVTANCNMWDNGVTPSIYAGVWGFQLIDTQGTAILYAGPLFYPTVPNNAIQPYFMFGRQWTLQAGSHNFTMKFWGDVNVVAAYSFMHIIGARKS